MEIKDFILTSKVDNNPISVKLYIPDENPKGILQIVHGMVDHKERYNDFMTFACSLGYVVIASDVRGHGLSVHNKDDLGYFYENGAYNCVEDIHQVTTYIKDRYPRLRVTLFGHSMGSLIVRNYIKKYDRDIRYLIVCGAPSYRPAVNFGLGLVKFLKLIFGDRHRSLLLKSMTLGNFNKNIKGKNKYRWLCNNEEVLKAYENDPLCQFNFTLNGYETLLTLLKEAYNEKTYQVNNNKLNILFISGKEDRTYINVDKWLEAQKVLENAGYSNISHKLYDNFRHEILNENDCEKVYLDIFEFIK